MILTKRSLLHVIAPQLFLFFLAAPQLLAVACCGAFAFAIAFVCWSACFSVEEDGGNPSVGALWDFCLSSSRSSSTVPSRDRTLSSRPLIYTQTLSALPAKRTLPILAVGAAATTSRGRPVCGVFIESCWNPWKLLSCDAEVPGETGRGESVMQPCGDRIEPLPACTAEVGVGAGAAVIGDALFMMKDLLVICGGKSPAGDGPDVELARLPRGG